MDWDWKNDLLHVRYDGKQITPAALLEAVGKKELQGKVVPGGP